MTSITPRGISIISTLNRVQEHYAKKMLWLMEGIPSTILVLSWIYLTSPREELRLSLFSEGVRKKPGETV